MFNIALTHCCALSICEQQADAFVRLHSSMRIASLRFGWVIPNRLDGATQLKNIGPNFLSLASRGLWGWVSTDAAARACLLGLTVPKSAFYGHEPFFIVAPTTMFDLESAELLKDTYPEIQDIRKPFKGNLGFFDCTKAEKVLEWGESDA